MITKNMICGSILKGDTESENNSKNNVIAAHIRIKWGISPHGCVSGVERCLVGWPIRGREPDTEGGASGRQAGTCTSIDFPLGGSGVVGRG